MYTVKSQLVCKIMKVTKAGVIITNKNYTKIVCVMNHITESMCEYKWGLPKGHKEPYETNVDCCIREVKEEVGINLFLSGPNHPHIIVYDTCYYLVCFNEERHYTPKDKYEISKIRWKKIRFMNNENMNRGLRAVVESWDEITEMFREYKNKNKKRNNHKNKYKSSNSYQYNYKNERMGPQSMDFDSYCVPLIEATA